MADILHIGEIAEHVNQTDDGTHNSDGGRKSPGDFESFSIRLALALGHAQLSLENGSQLSAIGQVSRELKAFPQKLVGSIWYQRLERSDPAPARPSAFYNLVDESGCVRFRGRQQFLHAASGVDQGISRRGYQRDAQRSAQNDDGSGRLEKIAQRHTGRSDADQDCRASNEQSCEKEAVQTRTTLFGRIRVGLTSESRL